MRTIKFRAWDSTRKEMIATGFHIIGEVTMFSVIEQYLSENKIEGKTILDRLADVVISQFTGLHDSEGKEIYEGDVLLDRLGRKKVVEYFKDGFWLNERQNGALWELRQVNDSCKVIGNIYENPDLIS